MIGLEDLDHLLIDSFAAWARLSEAERWILGRICRRRKRLGSKANNHLSAEDVEFLEDCAARNGVRPTGYHVRSRQRRVGE